MPFWSESIAVGSERFVKDIHGRLAAWEKRRRKRRLSYGFELREGQIRYDTVFDPQKSDIGAKNNI